jgi:outer membrane lipoprotein carrier protein
MTSRGARPKLMPARPLVALALLGSILAGTGRAEEGCAAAVAERVQRHYDGIRDLSANFEQRTDRVALGGAGSEALVASGAVVFAKPGKMRWTYKSPEPSLVVSDGSTLWIYDEKAAEVQKLSLAEGFLSAAGLQFLLGGGELGEEFEITALQCDAPAPTLVLLPKRPTQYERLELKVDPRSGAVLETTVSDLFGNRTVVSFREVRENAGVAKGLFRFAPPAGVRVVEMPPAP